MDVTLPDRVEGGTGLALYKAHRLCEGGNISVMNCDQQSLYLSPLSFLTHFRAPHGQTSCAHTTAPGPLLTLLPLLCILPSSP